MRSSFAYILLFAAACSRTPPPPPTISATPSAPTPTVAPVPPPPAPPPPAVVTKVAVPKDGLASIVQGLPDASLHTIFLPGMCSNAGAYLHAFPRAAQREGGVLAIEGDQPCVPGYHTFSWDAAKQHARIEAALVAAGVHEIPAGGLTIVGYSQGASIAEQLAARWPERYTRVVLIGAPTDPSTKSLSAARGVVTMSCDHDVPWRMKEAARLLSRKGVPATYVQMPTCSHGHITDGDTTFDTAFAFLTTSSRAAKTEPIKLPDPT